ncbi:MAG TPA: hypothetical protein VGF48_01555 [Thermoanaerobaculia bacterium]|jgi:hypothetical protein
MRPILSSFLLLVGIAAPAIAQVSQRPVDAVVPVVGSTPGAFGARFRTEMQVHNAANTRATGWLIFRPQGPNVPTSPIVPYDLPARTTIGFDDVVERFGYSGLGSVDILVDKGELPVIVTRAYDEQEGRTTGVSVPLVPIGEVLTRLDTTAALIVPRDRGRYRFNIGIRSMDNVTVMELVTRNTAGAVRHRRTLTVQPNELLQQAGDAVAGVTLGANDSIEIRITSGSAVVYATTVDNSTNDSSLQLVDRR